MLPPVEVSCKKIKGRYCLLWILDSRDRYSNIDPRTYRSAFAAVFELDHLPPNLSDLHLVHAPDAAPVELVPDGPNVPVEADTHLHLLLSGTAIVITDCEFSGVGKPSSNEPLRALLDLELEWLVLQHPGPGGRLLSLSAPLPEGDIELYLLGLLCEMLQIVSVECQDATLLLIPNDDLDWDFSMISSPDGGPC